MLDVAIPFKNHYKLNDKVQEFNIFFDPDKNSLDTLIEFIQTFENHIINIEYRNGIDVKTATALSKISDRVRFILSTLNIEMVLMLRPLPLFQRLAIGCVFVCGQRISLRLLS